VNNPGWRDGCNVFLTPGFNTNRSLTGLNPQSLQVEFGWIELLRATSTRIFSHANRI
jgi:hypothetical protein